jgi:geranylgeranyl diphosphate synthase type I
MYVGSGARGPTTVAGAPTSAAAARDDAADVRTATDAALSDFLEDKLGAAPACGLPLEVVGVLAGLLAAGGKRIRPRLCVLGWQAAGGCAVPRAVVRVAASLELFHAFAVIHDDVMDASDLRRGRPTVHRALAERYADRADADRLGASLAILVGDLALAWADEMVNTATLTESRRRAVCGVLDEMRTQVMAGQYRDLLACAEHGRDPDADQDADEAMLIARLKTASYTVRGPLLAGAVLAGADEDVVAGLSAFAIPLGEAFQLRDDLLGAFGDPSRTGKAAGEDLREGKHTALLVLAHQAADAGQRRVLARASSGREQDVAEARRVLWETGSVDAVEEMIRDRHRRALAALARIPVAPAVRDELEALARQAVQRTA